MLVLGMIGGLATAADAPGVVSTTVPPAAVPPAADLAAMAVIDGPTESVAGQLVVFDAASSTGTGYDWLVSADVNTDGLWQVFEDGRYLAFASPIPGKYRIVLSVAVEGQSNVVELTFQNGEPGPPPDPPPFPPGQKWQVVIVYESAQLDNYSPEQQSIIKSLTFREQVTAAGHKILSGGIIDQGAPSRTGEPPKSLAPYLAAAKSKSLPRLCISAMTGGTVQTFPLMADEAAVLNFLNGVK